MAGGSRRAAMRAAERQRLRAGEQAEPARPTVEQAQDGWVVRRVAAPREGKGGGGGGKAYRCPGCDQLLGAIPHVVAWPEGRPDERRHWHTPCWAARTRRGAVVQRSRNAPRYG